jgi:futalosine hydrolase
VLVLVPTELELARLVDDGGLPLGAGLVETCGFGPVAAAARTAALVARLTPARVFLIGIAGSLDLERAPIGSAFEPGAVAIEGIGVGEGARAIGPAALGFPQWPARAQTGTPSIEERIDLPASRARSDALLLSTCSASDSPEHAALRSERFPDAVAEDMEGFGVALACALARTPLVVVRGISNAAGLRDPATWRIPSALRAARRRLCELLEEHR